MDDSGEGKVKYLVKFVRWGFERYREVERKHAVRARDRGGNVRVEGPGASGKARSVEKENSGNTNVMRDDSAEHGPHYQPKKREKGPEGRGHTDYEVSSPAAIGALAAYGTASYYLGEDSVLGAVIDFFNPVSDIQETANLIADLSSEEVQPQDVAPPPTNTEESEPAKESGDCEITQDFIFCWAPE